MTSFLIGCFPCTPVRRTTVAVFVPLISVEFEGPVRGPARPTPIPPELEPMAALVKKLLCDSMDILSLSLGVLEVWRLRFCSSISLARAKEFSRELTGRTLKGSAEDEGDEEEERWFAEEVEDDAEVPWVVVESEGRAAKVEGFRFLLGLSPVVMIVVKADELRKEEDRAAADEEV